MTEWYVEEVVRVPLVWACLRALDSKDCLQEVAKQMDSDHQSKKFEVPFVTRMKQLQNITLQVRLLINKLNMK